jgi:hypothetical protein
VIEEASVTSEGPYEAGHPQEGYPPDQDAPAGGHARPYGGPQQYGTPPPQYGAPYPGPEQEPEQPPVPPSADQSGARAAVRMPSSLRAEPGIAPIPSQAPPQGQVYGRPAAPATYGSPQQQPQPGVYGAPQPPVYGGPPPQQPGVYGGTYGRGPDLVEADEAPVPRPAAPPMPAEGSGRSTPRVYGSPTDMSEVPDDPYGGPPRATLPQQRGGGPAWLVNDPPGSQAPVTNMIAGPPQTAPAPPGVPPQTMAAASMPAPPIAPPPMPAPPIPPPGAPQAVTRAPGVYGRPAETPPAGPQPLYGGGDPMPRSGDPRQPDTDAPPYAEVPVRPAGRPEPAIPAWQEQLAAGPRPAAAPGAPGAPSRPTIATSSPAATGTPATGTRLAGLPPAASGGGRWKKFGYIGVAIAVIGAGAYALYYTSRPNPPSFAVGSCLTEGGDGKPATASCSTAGAYQVVSRVADHAQCPDPNEQYIQLTGGDAATRVVCLKPVGS